MISEEAGLREKISQICQIVINCRPTITKSELIRLFTILKSILTTTSSSEFE